MTTKKLIGFLILIVTLSFITDNLYIITKGVGTDNLKVDKTKVKIDFKLLTLDELKEKLKVLDE